MQTPTLLALDFDGVLCDGLIEYFQTAWKAYCQIWSPADTHPPAGLAEQFYRLRPVVETGWEMPVVLRSLLLGQPEEKILAQWNILAQQQIQADGLTPAQLSAAVDGIRDAWIEADLNNWLAQHRFYPGVIDRLQQILHSPTDVFIVTTKEGRFVRQLLQQQGIALDESQIFGKEVQRPKAQTLRSLLQRSNHDAVTLWFIEDRLKTLQAIETQADLQAVRLFLADWGYNTPGDRNDAKADPNIRLLSLQEFAQDFSSWL